MTPANRFALAAGAVAAAALVAWALRPAEVTVDVAVVSRGAFEQTVADDGRTRVRDRYVVSAPLAGRIERIGLKAGDAVAAGQLIAVLRPAAPGFIDARTERELTERIGSAEAQHLRARAEAGRAQAQLAQANADRARTKKLAAGGFVSANALEQADLASTTAEKSLEAAQFAEHAAAHDADQARAALARYRSEGSGPKAGTRWEVRSPVTGSVLKVMQESEGAVALGAPLMEVADPRSLEAIVDVLSQDAVAIVAGAPARLEIGSGVPPLSARVRRVEPAAFTKVSALGVEEQRVNVVLDITDSLERIRTIGDGYRVEAHIVMYRTGEAVKAPLGALFHDAAGWAVFIADNGRAIKRTVTVARRNGAEAQIEAGLQPGESVVLYPPDALGDGSRIVVRANREAPR